MISRLILSINLCKIVMILVMGLLGLYFLLNVYNLAWLFLPSLGKLRRIMAAHKVTESYCVVIPP